MSINYFDDAEAAFALDRALSPSKPAKEAGDEPAKPAKAKSAEELAAEEEQRAAIKAAAAAIQDGIYFQLPMEVYRQVERVGSGSLCDLAVSPATFWNGSWMNPDKEKNEEAGKDETPARIMGSAYHCARLEPEHFELRYFRDLSRADFGPSPEGGIVTNGTQIGQALAELGQTKKRAEESVRDQAERLDAAGYPGVILPLEIARHREANKGKIPLDGDSWDAIRTDMERIHKNPDIAPKLSGGAAEVSIFWTDEYGIQCKLRADYLRPDLWDDFKTFENKSRKRLRQALVDALQYNRYHIQAVHYRAGIERVRTGGLQIQGEASDAERKLIAEIQLRPEELDCWYIFQEKKGVPNLLAIRFPFYGVDAQTEAEIQALARDENAARKAMARKTGLFIRALQDIDAAKREFMLYSQVYQRGQPWSPINPVSEFEDADFNSRWLEGIYA